MLPDVFTIPATITAAEAEALVRTPSTQVRGRARHGTLIYVIDTDRRLIGFVEFQDLVPAQPDQSVAELSSADPVWVRPLLDADQAAQSLVDYELAALPVVDDQRRLLGVLTADAAADIIETEATRTPNARADRNRSKCRTFSSVLPLPLKKCRVDPAVVSAPMIATIVGGTGLIIYFLVAHATMPQLAVLPDNQITESQPPQLFCGVANRRRETPAAPLPPRIGGPLGKASATLLVAAGVSAARVCHPGAGWVGEVGD